MTQLKRPEVPTTNDKVFDPHPKMIQRLHTTHQQETHAAARRRISGTLGFSSSFVLVLGPGSTVGRECRIRTGSAAPLNVIQKTIQSTDAAQHV